MPKKNKNRKHFNHKDRSRNNQLNHVTNGGISSNKWQNNRISNPNRKNYISPSVIEAIQKDEDFDVAPVNGPNPNKKRNKKNRHRAFQKLEENEVVKTVKTKLSIGDDSMDKKSMLPSKPHCKISSIPNDVFDLIIQYVQHYFTCFDHNREGLLGAYNSKSLFSLSLNLQNPASHRPFKFDDSLVKESRNLRRINKTDHQANDRKFRLIKKGHIEIVNFLSKLPQTEHEEKSFKLDNCYLESNMVSFSISGVFREGKPADNVRPLRCFHRVFVCIPDPVSKMHIVNEQLSISNMTTDQYKLYFEEKIQKIEENNQAISSEPLVNTTNLIDPKTQMIQRFSNESGLNLEWSEYCLQHAEWNYEVAGKNFIEFKDSIPKEAFKSV